MGNFVKSEANPFDIVEINPDKVSHISLVDREICKQGCENKPCTYFCPARVYSWTDEGIRADYTRCMECGACPFGCPHGNIDWQYPRGGFGVVYRY